MGSTPKPPKAPPPPAPPPTAAREGREGETGGVRRKQRILDKSRTGMKKSILAGETGGATSRPGKTLLG